MHNEKILEACKYFQKGQDILNGGPLSFYLSELAGANKYLIERFCPLNVGDRVRLRKEPVIGPDDGQWCFKDIMIVGAKGKVVSRECDSE